MAVRISRRFMVAYLDRRMALCTCRSSLRLTVWGKSSRSRSSAMCAMRSLRSQSWFSRSTLYWVSIVCHWGGASNRSRSRCGASLGLGLRHVGWYCCCIGCLLNSSTTTLLLSFKMHLLIEFHVSARARREFCGDALHHSNGQANFCICIHTCRLYICNEMYVCSLFNIS
jgi:hypothetical protein